MRIGWTVGMVLASAALAGCASAPATPAPHDVEFLRGCWVEKNAQDHRIDAFLRLLPDGPHYTGHLQYVRGIRPGPEIRVSFARDGTYASLTQNSERLDLPAEASTDGAAGDERYRVVFSGTTDGRYARIEMAGRTDRLAMTILNGVSMLSFNGERDGCD